MLKYFRTIRKKLIEQDNVRKYLLYAIGEIMLVVIGILIALQVNNWNEQRKEQAIVEELKSAILSDLKSDLVTIDLTLNEINSAIELFDSLQVTITAPGVSNEEVINALKNDFSPYGPRFNGFNDNTYRSSTASGTIALLNQVEREQLYSYYLKQSVASETFANYEVLYITTINEYNEDFPLKVPFVPFNSGPVYDRKWSNPDFDKLTSKFNKTGTTQRNWFRTFTIYLPEIRTEAERLIKELEVS
jgi:hypothetical protein